MEEAIAAALEAAEQLFIQLSHNLQETVARTMQHVYQSEAFHLLVQPRPQGIIQRSCPKPKPFEPLVSPEVCGADDIIQPNPITHQRAENKKKLRAKKKVAAVLFRQAAKMKKKVQQIVLPNPKPAKQRRMAANRKALQEMGYQELEVEDEVRTVKIEACCVA